MSLRRNALLTPLALAAAAVAVFATPVPSASAEPLPCPDVEVVFARGSGEAPGVGGTGQAFVDAMRAQAGDRTVGVYAVDYPASTNFFSGAEFARTVLDGVRNESDHLRAIAAACPQTDLVVGGFSQGAAVSGYVTFDAVPPQVPAGLAPPPLPDDVADRVAAVVLFGKPSEALIGPFGAPPVTVGSRFVAKTLELCAPGDTICSGVAGGGPTPAHSLYPVNGQATEGAAFAVSRL